MVVVVGGVGVEVADEKPCEPLWERLSKRPGEGSSADRVSTKREKRGLER